MSDPYETLREARKEMLAYITSGKHDAHRLAQLVDFLEKATNDCLYRAENEVKVRDRTIKLLHAELASKG